MAVGGASGSARGGQQLAVGNPGDSPGQDHCQVPEGRGRRRGGDGDGDAVVGEATPALGGCGRRWGGGGDSSAGVGEATPPSGGRRRSFRLGGDGDSNAGVREGTPERGGRSLRQGGDGDGDASVGEGTPVLSPNQAKISNFWKNGSKNKGFLRAHAQWSSSLDQGSSHCDQKKVMGACTLPAVKKQRFLAPKGTP